MILLWRYLELVQERLAALLLLSLVVGLGLAFLGRRGVAKRTQTLFGGALLVGALGLGLRFAYERAAVFDDAYISFRYADNLLAGNGLVFNVGERVEGFTNLLWTLLLAGLSFVTTVELPTLSLVVGVVVYVISVLVMGRLGWRLRGAKEAPYLPLAAPLFAVQATVCDFATSGLETLFASLCVNLGVLAIVSRAGVFRPLLAGTAFIAAALAHPDHLIFYGAGGLALFYPTAVAVLRERGLQPAWRAKSELAAYLAPLGAFGLVLVWRYVYYGSLVPNTYHAKSGGDAYFSQGIVYAWTYYLGSHLWLLLLPAAWWTVRAKRATPYRVFFATGFLLYNFYVMKLGGDFMYGRLYVVVTPLLLLAAEGFVYDVAARASKPNLARGLAAGLLMLTAHGVPLIHKTPRRYAGITDESRVYQVEWAYPLRIKHPNFRVGQLFRRVLSDRGLRPLIATSGIGMVGYYSKLPVLDLVGLTDPVVAKQPLRRRGRPGHEKWASEDYVRSRRPLLVRYPKLDQKYKRFSAQRDVRLGKGLPKGWTLLGYDREAIRQLRRTAPELRIPDFERYLDRYIARLDSKAPKEVRRDLRFFRRFYFDLNEDAARLAPLVARATSG